MAGRVILVLFILLILAGLAWVIRTLIEERQRQAKMMLRMRRDAERQERAIIRLAEGLNASMRQVNHLSESMEARQDRMRRTLDERMSQMQQANDQSLEKVRQTVSDKLDGRLNESFRLVNAQLANVHRGLGEMREITTGMTDLKKMLGGVKTRGSWGEVQLRALMAELFAPGQYVENAAIPEGSQQRATTRRGFCPSTPSSPRRTTCALWRRRSPATGRPCAGAPPSWSARCWSRPGASTTSTSTRP